MKKIAFILIIVILPCIAIGANKDDIGTSTMQFLKIGLGPRALAMGEAFTAVADDASSIYWNPAGLARLKNYSIETGYDMLIESIKYGHLLFGIPLHNEYSLGFGVSHLMQPNLSKYDEFGNPLGSVKPQDTAGFLCVAKHEDPLSIGVTAKYVSSRVGSAFAHTLAGDIGMILSFSNIDIGVAGQHIGGKIKFEKENETLPQTLRSGIAVYLLDNQNLIVSSDILLPNDNEPLFAGGMEVSFDITENRTAAIRAGYNSQAQDIGGIIGVSAGFGFTFDQYSCNYAWIPYGDLGTSHRISFSVSFGEDVRAPHKEYGRKHLNQKEGKKGKKFLLFEE